MMTQLLVLCVGSAAFSGSGRIMMSAAEALADSGIRVHVVSLRPPFHQPKARADGRLTMSCPPALRSGACGEHGAFLTLDSLSSLALAEECARVAEQHSGIRLLVWGHFLFPFGVAARIAVEILAAQHRDVTLWLTPAGSDVWELGPDLRRAANWLLRRPGQSPAHPQRVLTYSEEFSAEVVRTFVLSRTPDVFTPAVDAQFLTDGRYDESSAERKASTDWLLTTHSNLRSVKRFEFLLDVVERVAAKNPRRELVLRVAGPPFTYRPREANLSVHGLGVQSKLARHLSDSDAEINFSIHDSFNLSVVESACLGVPVLSTDCIGARPLLERYGCAEFVPTAWARDREVEACAVALNDLLQARSESRRRVHAPKGLWRAVSRPQLQRTLTTFLQADARLG